jgi:outer membrane biosynthesis protein TonB
MIAIRNSEGEVLKNLTHTSQDRIFFHQNYGFLTASTWKSRQKMRKRSGLRLVSSKEAIQIEIQDKKISTKSPECEIQTADQGYQVQLRGQLYQLQFLEAAAETKLTNVEPLKMKSNRWKLAVPLVLLLLIGSFFAFGPSIDPVPTAEEQVIAKVEPVIVKVVEVKTVTPAEQQQVKPQQELKAPAIDEKSKAQKVLTQNLGFLKLVGKKDLKKANGGLPTKLENASAGAGAGGSEGSGGELLTGLGKGLRQTTVGNSGTQGLGGVGTHGAGGGLGGYGETGLSGAGARSLSAVPLSQEAKVEGGLDRAVIQATILRYLSQVRACYEEGLKRKDNLVGQITMDFEINAMGNLNFANVQKSSLGDPEVESCVSHKMIKWKFPLPRGGVNVKVSYPFMLRPIKS